MSSNGTVSGHYVKSTTAGEQVRAFVPAPLPPKMLELSRPTRTEMERAMLALGRLDSAAWFLPDHGLLLYFYVRKEAVLSSRIEGIQSSFADLLLHELKEVPGVPIDDVAEVSRYVDALSHGIKRLKGDFPLSNRLIREMHARLLAHGRGEQKSPGEFRRSQNWIGGTRPGNANFVPPPPDKVEECMGKLEKFMHEDSGRFGILEKAALIHVQFESIHPFLDGDGRVGRLLIPLLFCVNGILKEPVLYVSLFFQTHRQEYYKRLDRVRTHGDWDGWIHFFCEAVAFSAEQATATAENLSALAQTDRTTILNIGRKATSVLRVFDMLLARPLINIPEIGAGTGLAPNTIASCLHELTKIGIVEEVSGRRRNRLFAYQKLLELLQDEGK